MRWFEVLIAGAVLAVGGWIVLLNVNIRESDHHLPVRLVDKLVHAVRHSQLNHGSVTIDPSICEAMLRRFDAVCRKHGVEFWLSEGTALGAVREQRILPDDTDMDVYLRDLSHWPAFHDRVMPELLASHGWSVYKDRAHYRFVTLVHRDQYLDVSVMAPGEHCSAVPGPCDELAPHVGELRRVRLGLDEYWAPSDAYLEFLYGPTWQTPRARFKPVDAKAEAVRVESK